MDKVWSAGDRGAARSGARGRRSGLLWALGTLGMVLLAPRGAEAQGVRTITLSEAVEIALERSSEVRTALNSVAQRDVAVSERQMGFFPSLTLTSGGAQNYGRYFSEAEGQILSQTAETVNFGASASVTLFDGLANVAELRSAGLERDASALGLDRSRQTAVITVLSGFLQLVERREQLRVQRENFSQQEEQEAQIQAYVTGGTRPISDLYQQRATVAAARVAVLEAANAAKLAEVEIIRTLQLDPLGEYEFQLPPEPAAPTAQALQAELTDLLQTAFQMRSDLSAAEMQASALEQSARAATAGYWPTVSLTARYNADYQSTSTLEFWDQLDQRRGGSLSLNFSIPVFDRFTTRNSVQRAELQIEGARIGIEQARQEIASEVRAAYQNYLTSFEQLIASTAQVEASMMALESTQERYDAGVATLLEVTQARTALVEANSGLIRARYNAAILEKLLEYYTGELDTETQALL